MAEPILGLDFGTTNSLAAQIDERTGRPRSLTNIADDRPHPSTVWYRAGEVIVGREARSHLDTGEDAISGAFVRSPKRLLIKEAPVDVEGTQIDPRDIVAEVLRHLKKDAASPARGDAAIELNRVVMTIPVDLDGDGRRRLREAAGKAGIGVVQFVHEPLAALYAWFRSHADYERRVAELEGRRILVFDWGGGTLDLTLCLVRGRQLVQLANVGDNEVGGDYFDDLVRNFVRDLHAAQHNLEDIVRFETTESRTRLLAQCERAKIELSDLDTFPVFVPNYLKTDQGKHLSITISREDLERWTGSLIDQGLAQIDKLLEAHQLTPQEIELCLPTGGMVNVPAVRDGLIQRFGGRVPRLPNGDRIIAEGAAWVAYDRLQLSLAKPIELLQPDGSYVEIVAEGQKLPVENQVLPVMATQFYCVDPRDGIASFQFARPTKVGYGARNSPRRAYVIVPLKVDPLAAPFFERLNVSLTIDHNYIVNITAHSSGRNDRVSREIHNLEFALSLPAEGSEGRNPKGDTADEEPEADPASHSFAAAAGSIQLRSNVSRLANNWRQVPGDIIGQWRPNWFDVRSGDSSALQRKEQDYYCPCAQCRRSAYQIESEGCDQCGAISSMDAAQRRRERGIEL